MKELVNFQIYKDFLLEQLSIVPFNTLFAESVVREVVNGKIFVDDIETPHVFYIIHPYGMSLLLGENCNGFELTLFEYILNLEGKRNKIEWMQAYPYSWYPMMERMAKLTEIQSLVEIDVRINFILNKTKYRKRIQNQTAGIKIQETSVADFENMAGSVIPKYFWRDSLDFTNNGIGYSLYYQQSLASVAFSAFINHHYLELGIETQLEFRGRDFAYNVCSALINYCLMKGLEPVWACGKTNLGSYRLATKLGFEEFITTPYYKLYY